MKIRKAEEKDIPRLLVLLGQVLQIHAEIRPDIFIPGTTKYTVCELKELLKQENKPIYVAVNENDVCMGRLLSTQRAAFFHQHGTLSVAVH